MPRLGAILLVIVLGAATVIGYRLAKSHVAEQLYLERLEQVTAQYEQLRGNFNQAVKKTAVTELLVNEDDSICVSFVNIDGTEKIIPTPFKKGSVIWVDILVMDGRAYPRRVFDDNTAPNKALVIDPKLQEVNWESGEVSSGKATYYKLNKTGRWTVTMTGNGALDIVKKPDDSPPTKLTPAAPVHGFETIERQVDAQLSEIGPKDVIQKLLGMSDTASTVVAYGTVPAIVVILLGGYVVRARRRARIGARAA